MPWKCRTDSCRRTLVQCNTRIRSCGLGIAANLFGISKVLFLGKMLEAGDLFLEPIERVVRHDSIAPLSRDLTFRAGPLPSPDAAVGAAYLALGRYFEGDLNIHPTTGGTP